MTLILAMGNPDHTILVSDRRLSQDGNPVDEESNKAVVVTTRDATMAVAFSGLAEWDEQNFRTAIWICEGISGAAAPDHLARPLIRRFSSAAEAPFAGLNVARKYKGLVVVFAGYMHVDSGAWQPLVLEVSNVDEDWTAPERQFTVSTLRDDPSDRRAYVMAEGRTTAVDRAKLDDLLSMVEQGKPAHALVNRAVDIIRTASDSARAGNTIGKQCTSIVLPADPSLGATTEYHTMEPCTTTYGVSYINAVGGDTGVFAIADPYITTEHDDSDWKQPVALPKPGRNDRCWCGSGLKFKRCHGASGKR